MALQVGTARIMSRFLASVVEDTIEVPLHGDEDVFYDTEDLYERFAAFCAGFEGGCAPFLSLDQFDRVLAQADG
jgi:hypothetical protein